MSAEDAGGLSRAEVRGYLNSQPQAPPPTTARESQSARSIQMITSETKERFNFLPGQQLASMHDLVYQLGTISHYQELDAQRICTFFSDPLPPPISTSLVPSYGMSLS